jgi:flagellar assembly protein FliH
MSASFEFDFAPLETSVALVTDDDPAVAAAELLTTARAEADVIRATAHAEGFANGREQALAELAPAASALEQAARAVREDAEAGAQRLEARAVDLALLLAEKVVAAAVAVDPELVVGTVRGALRGLVERERIAVLVHPDDLELVRGAMGDLVASLGGIQHCEVQAERRVGRGGAIVRTPEGDVDARLETKLERAREVVESALGES